jgi:hypothetical protein
MLNNKTELSPIRGTTGQNFDRMDANRNNTKSSILPTFGNIYVRHRERVATKSDARNNSLINQNGRTNCS